MKNMPKEDFELFKIIVQSTQNKLHKILYKLLKRHYKNIINTNDYLFAQGDIPVALVAHMDTVFKLPPRTIYCDREAGVLWSPDGLGADDRAGVFLIIKILQSVPKDKKPTIILTTDEELGCLGSNQLATDLMPERNAFKYIIQLDRRGKKDCVFYDDANKDFHEYVENFGFETNWGSFSDISIICPSWGVSGVNLSVGYEDEHQEIETLHIKYLYETFNKVLNMLEKIDDAPYFTYVPFKYGYWCGGVWPGYDDEEDDEEYWYQTVKCHQCGKTLNKILAIKTMEEDGSYNFYCGSCTAPIDWCDTCGRAFINHSKWNHTCGDCLIESWENKCDAKENGRIKIRHSRHSA